MNALPQPGSSHRWYSSSARRDNPCSSGCDVLLLRVGTCQMKFADATPSISSGRLRPSCERDLDRSQSFGSLLCCHVTDTKAARFDGFRVGRFNPTTSTCLSCGKLIANSVAPLLLSFKGSRTSPRLGNKKRVESRGLTLT